MEKGRIRIGASRSMGCCTKMLFLSCEIPVAGRPRQEFLICYYKLA